MSADVLRRASARIRSNHDYAPPSEHDRFMLAVADWLETVADRDPTGQSVEAEPALAVALAYLGEEAS